jgi:antitoxin CptB
MSDLNQLRWRCRRGTLELDLILSRYLQQHYATSSPEQQQAFRELLSLEDSELMRYLLGGVTAERAETRQLIALMLQTDPKYQP